MGWGGEGSGCGHVGGCGGDGVMLLWLSSVRQQVVDGGCGSAGAVHARIRHMHAATCAHAPRVPKPRRYTFSGETCASHHLHPKVRPSPTPFQTRCECIHASTQLMYIHTYKYRTHTQTTTRAHTPTSTQTPDCHVGSMYSRPLWHFVGWCATGGQVFRIHRDGEGLRPVWSGASIGG